MDFLRKNWFILGILVALVLGFTLAGPGSRLDHGKYLSTALTVALFLISGMKLPSESIMSGIKDLKLHLYIQIFLFGVTPAFFYLTSLPFRGELDGTVVIGFYALAVLPTTISSCIIFTQMAEGNVVATMFNAALANVAGVVLSPLLLSALMRTAGKPLPIAELLLILQNLGLKMLLPIVVGQFLRRFIKPLINRRGKLLSNASNIFILMILFLSFAKSAVNPDFTGNLRRMAVPFLYVAGAHIVLVALAYAGGRALRFPHKSLISVVFAAPQKTLAMGVPLIGTYFAGSPEILGIALLPLLFYHPWQLLIAGFLPRLMERFSAGRIEPADRPENGGTS